MIIRKHVLFFAMQVRLHIDDCKNRVDQKDQISEIFHRLVILFPCPFYVQSGYSRVVVKETVWHSFLHFLK